MDVAVEEKSPVSKTVSITLPEADLAADISKRLAKMGSRARVPGFRPGKIPPKLLKQKYGQSARLDAIDAAVRKSLNEALGREELAGTVHVSRPDIKSGVNEGEDVVFEFVAESLPTLAPVDYEGVAVQMLDVQVTDEDVDREVQQLRDQAAVITPVEDRDTVEATDVVVVSYQGVGEGEVTEIHADDQQIELGDPALLDGFASGLVGAKVGEKTSVEVQLPEEFGLESIAGQKVTLEVTVSAIKRRELPELDDDFAADQGEFDTLAALTADIRARLEADRTRGAEVGARRRLVEAVVAANPVELPQLYVEARALEEAEYRLRSLAAQGLDLKTLGTNIPAFAASLKADVAGAIHESIVMRGIAEAQSITVTDEDLEAWMQGEATKSGQPLAKLKARYAHAETRDALRSRLAYDRVVDWVWSKAKVEKVAELPNPDHGAPGHVHGPDCDHD